MNEGGFCKAHQMIEKQIEDARGLIKWGIGVFLAIAMAVVGFLWHGQVVLWNKMESNQDFLINPKHGILIEMNQKLDKHLLEWPRPARDYVRDKDNHQRRD